MGAFQVTAEGNSPVAVKNMACGDNNGRMALDKQIVLAGQKNLVHCVIAELSARFFS